MQDDGNGEFERSCVVRFTGHDRFVVDALDPATLELGSADNYRSNEWGIPFPSFRSPRTLHFRFVYPICSPPRPLLHSSNAGASSGDVNVSVIGGWEVRRSPVAPYAEGRLLLGHGSAFQVAGGISFDLHEPPHLSTFSRGD